MSLDLKPVFFFKNGFVSKTARVTHVRYETAARVTQQSASLVGHVSSRDA
jgi:hypothetical protein